MQRDGIIHKVGLVDELGLRQQQILVLVLFIK